MNETFSNEQLSWIRDQAMIYQCACPAHVCVAIETIRTLYNKQLACLDSTTTDHEVHHSIKVSAEKTHAELERCLTDILQLEGWDMQTLKMPAYLQKRLLDESCD